MQVNILEARTRFSELIAKVEIGEEVTIARAGRPVARIVPIRERKEKRVAGLASGKITIRDDFDAPLPPEMLAQSGLRSVDRISLLSPNSELAR